MSNYYDEQEKKAVQDIKDLLKLPVEEDVHSESFDPWRPFSASLYGSYSSGFDDMALAVLTDILNNTHNSTGEYGLAAEMFREILCNKGLCDYGTSPRTCFANKSFKELLPEYLEKWRQYYDIQWVKEF